MTCMFGMRALRNVFLPWAPSTLSLGPPLMMLFSLGTDTPLHLSFFPPLLLSSYNYSYGILILEKPHLTPPSSSFICHFPFLFPS